MPLDWTRYARRLKVTPPMLRTAPLDAAFQEAKDSRRCLVVFVHSRERKDSVRFFQQVFCSDIVSEVLNSSYITWAVDGASEEAVHLLDELAITDFPAITIISPLSKSLREPIIMYTKCGRLPDAPSLVDVLLDTTSRLGDITASRDAASTSPYQSPTLEEHDTLRAEQQTAYQHSLEADRRREDEARQAEYEAARQKEEEELLEAIQASLQDKAMQDMKARAEDLTEEPVDGINVRIKLPNNKALARRFRSEEDVGMLYNFLDSVEVDSTAHMLYTVFPRQALDERKTVLGELFAGQVALVAVPIE
ncbi:UBX domain [Carpediemonas membranifera]|uniref:UBX domain n=1 Tax=Carpediemonas membranifera TaxID=201153 RepID=A0A8J6E604_9EUKA|nr:UBX domain [Carpediemonas membranifera]|eukprot:KAG9396532.1 UBX domain [Carpediemonas membranifera]